VAAFVLVVAASTVALVWLGNQTKDDIEQAQLEGCQRANLNRAYLLIRSRSVKTNNPADVQLAEDLNSIVSCTQTKNAGHTIIATRPVSLQYQCIVQHQRRWPILDDQGRVEYTKPLPGKAGAQRERVKPCGP